MREGLVRGRGPREVGPGTQSQGAECSCSDTQDPHVPAPGPSSPRLRPPSRTHRRRRMSFQGKKSIPRITVSLSPDPLGPPPWPPPRSRSPRPSGSSPAQASVPAPALSGPRVSSSAASTPLRSQAHKPGPCWLPGTSPLLSSGRARARPCSPTRRCASLPRRPGEAVGPASDSRLGLGPLLEPQRAAQPPLRAPALGPPTPPGSLRRPELPFPPRQCDSARLLAGDPGSPNRTPA